VERKDTVMTESLLFSKNAVVESIIKVSDGKFATDVAKLMTNVAKLITDVSTIRDCICEISDHACEIREQALETHDQPPETRDQAHETKLTKLAIRFANLESDDANSRMDNVPFGKKDQSDEETSVIDAEKSPMDVYGDAMVVQDHLTSCERDSNVTKRPVNAVLSDIVLLQWLAG
jgi:hypothetical protein